MKNIKIEVTLPELLILNSLMSDQLFRREFIDPKMPGYKRDPAELAAGKELGRRLKALAQELSGTATRHASGQLSPNPRVMRTAV
jgi:hypothetical protein